jgi:hypothetical protein
MKKKSKNRKISNMNEDFYNSFITNVFRYNNFMIIKLDKINYIILFLID